MSDQSQPPADNHPPEDDGNFLHVVIYAGIFLVIGFIIAFLVIKGVGRHIVPGKHNPHPTSQLVSPSMDGAVVAAQYTSEVPFIFTQQRSQTCV